MIRLSLKVSALVALVNEVFRMIFVCLVMWYILFGRPVKKRITVIYWRHGASVGQNLCSISQMLSQV